MSMWHGKINKSAVVGRYHAQVFKTIDGDYAWVVWNVAERWADSDVAAQGRVETELEALEAAEAWLATAPPRARTEAAVQVLTNRPTGTAKGE